MSISTTLAARLIEASRKNSLSGASVMLGRQRWALDEHNVSVALLKQVLAEYMPETESDDLFAITNTYAEAFFSKLGFSSVDSLDFSDYEKASIIQDLSTPVPAALEGRFDMIYDGGTCEHVFELPTAFRNIDRMLKPGGVLIGHSPADGWLNHGFYQFTPELVFGFWEKSMGYEVLHCWLQPIRPRNAAQRVGVTNPNKTGVRPRILGTLPAASRTVLDYAVRKPLDGSPAKRAYQSDYLVRWQKGAPGRSR